jgi:hypothetical protein
MYSPIFPNRRNSEHRIRTISSFSIGQRLVTSPFGLIGTDENALSAALAWTFRCCPELLRWFLQQLGISGIHTQRLASAEVVLQKYEHFGRSRGLTDIEIRLGDEFHVIIEAKVGPAVPSLVQCKKYGARLQRSSAEKTKLVALVQAEDHGFVERYAAVNSALGEVLCLVTWQQVLSECRRLARGIAVSPESRVWCGYLQEFLQQEYVMNTYTTEVWILAASREPIWDNGLSHWDIHRQFHLWWDYTETQVRPLYLAFRVSGQLDSIWRVNRIEHDVPITEHVPPLKQQGISWAKKPATIWHLEPPVPLQRTLRTGPGMYNRRVRCHLDLLLTCDTVQQIEQSMRERRT